MIRQPKAETVTVRQSLSSKERKIPEVQEGMEFYITSIGKVPEDGALHGEFVEIGVEKREYSIWSFWCRFGHVDGMDGWGEEAMRRISLRG